MKKTIAILLTLLFVTPCFAETDEQLLKNYVQKLISDGYKLFNDKSLSDKEEAEQTAELLEKNLHLEWMAKNVLGRHRKSLDTDKITEFSAVYSKFVVKAYVDLAKHYNGEKATLKKVTQIDEDMFIVNMEIIKPDNGSTIKVDYLVYQLENLNGKPFKVADVITEGVSILNSQQAEFNSIITNQGIDALIANLKTKLENSGTKNAKNGS